jgi:hypothetical protein
METKSNIAGLENVIITINTYETYSEAVLSNLPNPFTNAQQEALMNELNVDVLVF